MKFKLLTNIETIKIQPQLSLNMKKIILASDLALTYDKALRYKGIDKPRYTWTATVNKTVVKGSRPIRTPDAPDVSVVDIPVLVVADDMELVVMALIDAVSVVAKEDATELPADIVCWDVLGDPVSVCVKQISVDIEI